MANVLKVVMVYLLQALGMFMLGYLIPTYACPLAQLSDFAAIGEVCCETETTGDCSEGFPTTCPRSCSVWG